jgi:preprotein translocase subunit YajC
MPLAMAGGGQGSSFMTIPMLLIMFAIFYVMLIRPQQRKEKERRTMIENVKTGDRVIFGGGFIGMITNVKDKTFVVRIADNTKVEIVRAAVVKVLAKDEEVGEDL